MKIILVSKCFLDIEQYVELKMSVLISPSKSLISSRWVTYIPDKKIYYAHNFQHYICYSVLPNTCILIFGTF